jgi:3-keto-disaccharide hydrolase
MFATILRFAQALILIMATSSALWADDWRPLFDGKSLDGWTQKGGQARYRVEDGQIVGQSVPNTQNSFLCTNKDYGDFILELEFKVDPKLNSGVQIRSQCFDKPTEFGRNGKKRIIPAGRVHGYQVEIDPSERAWSGGIYDEARRGWLKDLKDNPSAQKAFKPGDWNKFRIECRGDRIKTWINGVPAADLKDDMTPVGLIALQVHAVGAETEPREVRWRNIRIQELGK